MRTMSGGGMTDRSTGPRPSYQVSAELRPPRAVSALCIVTASAFFVGAWMMACFAASEVNEFFYQPRILAVVHSLTLGWISLTIMGVLYQFIPALTKCRVSWPGAAMGQVVLFATGALGMVVSFWFGQLEYTAWSATAVAMAVAIFVGQIVPSLLRARSADATVVGLLCALAYFAITALLGLLYAWDKVYGFLGGSVLSNIAGHAHMGFVGWITLTICAVSYRVVTAFLLPTEVLPKSAYYQIVMLAAVVPLLSAALLMRTRWAMLPALAGVGAMVWYAVILAGIARTRRSSVDWAMGHVIAAVLHLFAALLCGLLLFAVDPQSRVGSRMTAAYGILLLVGWVSNYIVGIGSRLAPPLVGLGREPLLVGGHAAIVFFLLNGALTAMVISLAAGNVWGIRVSVLALLASGFLVAGHVARRVLRPGPSGRGPVEVR